jgi:hypothetical protein
MAGSYICDSTQAGCPDHAPNPFAPVGLEPPHFLPPPTCWHESTRRRLEWQYGENRVDEDDIARWNALGSRKAVAA